MLGTFFLLMFIAVIVWLWSDSLRCREQALRACADVCRQLDVQFLDQTVALARIALERGLGGQLVIRRTYTFEFSADGMHRSQGRVQVVGRRVEYVHAEHPGGVTILES